MINPHENESNEDHGYVCQDCKRFQSGRCHQEDECGEICQYFERGNDMIRLAIERQVIVTWITPEERTPEEDVYVVVSFSGKVGNVTYDHAIGTAAYFDDGWYVVGTEYDLARNDSIIVHAWADLEPYQGGECDALS